MHSNLFVPQARKAGAPGARWGRGVGGTAGCSASYGGSPEQTDAHSGPGVSSYNRREARKHMRLGRTPRHPASAAPNPVRTTANFSTSWLLSPGGVGCGRAGGGGEPRPRRHAQACRHAGLSRTAQRAGCASVLPVLSATHHAQSPLILVLRAWRVCTYLRLLPGWCGDDMWERPRYWRAGGWSAPAGASGPPRLEGLTRAQPPCSIHGGQGRFGLLWRRCGRAGAGCGSLSGKRLIIPPTLRGSARGATRTQCAARGSAVGHAEAASDARLGRGSAAAVS